MTKDSAIETSESAMCVLKMRSAIGSRFLHFAGGQVGGVRTGQFGRESR